MNGTKEISNQKISAISQVFADVKDALETDFITNNRSTNKKKKHVQNIDFGRIIVV